MIIILMSLRSFPWTDPQFSTDMKSRWTLARDLVLGFLDGDMTLPRAPTRSLGSFWATTITNRP